MNDLQALITGTIAGVLARAEHLDIEVELQGDGEGNYLPEILVKGRQSGTRLLIEVRDVTA